MLNIYLRRPEKVARDIYKPGSVKHPPERVLFQYRQNAGGVIIARHRSCRINDFTSSPVETGLLLYSSRMLLYN